MSKKRIKPMDDNPQEPYDPEQALANAIIAHAVKEYRAALKHLRKDPDNVSADGEKKRLELFFHSDWFAVLSGNADP